MDGRTPEEWFPTFVPWLMGSLAMPDWPRRQDAFWVELQRLATEHRVTSAEAARVVREMFAGSGSVAFAREFPVAMLARVQAIRREEAAATAARLRASASETLSASAHQSECERIWATMDEASREEWRGLVRRRMPFLAQRRTPLELLAMAWCAFPSEIPPEPTNASTDFGPPLRHREPPSLRVVMEPDRILDPPPQPKTSAESTPEFP